MSDVLVYTDDEPDDRIALAALFASLPRDEARRLFVVVGEREVTQKIDDVRRYVALLLQRNDAFGKVIVRGVFESELRSFLESTRDVGEVYHLKPPREECLALAQGLALREYRGKATARVYGSFNWRTLDGRYASPQRLAEHYAKLTYVDSFSAIGEMNSFHFRPRTPSDVANAICSSIKAWNVLIVEEAQRTVDSLATPIDEREEQKKRRNQKIVDNVSAGIDTQFVMADPLVIWCRPTTPVKLVSMDPYPVWEPCEGSNVFAFVDGPEAKALRRVEVAVRMELLL